MYIVSIKCINTFKRNDALESGKEETRHEFLLSSGESPKRKQQISNTCILLLLMIRKILGAMKAKKI